MKYLYCEFIHPILDYFYVIRKNELVYEWGIPLLLSIVIYIWSPYIRESFVKDFLSTIINLFAILIGFTIAAIAIFTTADITNLNLLSKASDRNVLGVKISWFRFVYLNLIYAVIAEIIMLLTAVIFLILISVLQEKIIISFVVFGTLHCLFLTMRNTANLYYIFGISNKTTNNKN